MDHLARQGQRALARERGVWAAQMAEAMGSASVADVIHQMRARARSAGRRGNWVLAALLVTILAGLTYYVGFPIWQQLADGNKREYETDARYAREELAELDDRRDVIWSEIVAATALTGMPVATPFGPTEALSDGLSVEPDGAVVLSTTTGSVFVSSNGGDDWVSALLGTNVPGASRLTRSVDGTALHLWYGGTGQPWRMESDFAFQKGPGAPIMSPTWPPMVSVDGGVTWTGGSMEGDLFTIGVVLPRISRLLRVSGADVQFILLGGALMRSDDFDSPWRRVDLADESSAWAGLHLSRNRIAGTERYLAVALDRSIWEYDVAGDEWVELPRLRLEAGFYVNTVRGLSHDERALRIGFIGRASEQAEERELVNGATSWVWPDDAVRPSFDGSAVDVQAPIVVIDDIVDEDVPWETVVSLGGRRFGISYGGDVMVDDGSGTFEMHHDRTDVGEVGLAAASADGQTALVLIMTRDEEIGFLASLDSGETWLRVPFAPGIELDDLTGTVLFAYDGDRPGFLLAYQSARGARVMRFDGAVAGALAGVPILAGLAGDTAMAAAMDALPDGLVGDPILSPLVGALDDALDERTALVEALETAEARAADISGTGVSAAQQRADYAAFLEICPEGEGQSGSCTNAFLALQEAQEESLWEIVAERAPQAILLLFLLATLGNLYRYNLRIAGFHASRADLLELLTLRARGEGLAGFEAPEAFAALADALAADRVEFGKASSPSDQAAAVMRAALGRN